MRLVGDLKEKVEKTETKEEAKKVIEKAGMELTDEEMDQVAGGAGNWQQYAKGSYVNYGKYIVYSVVGGDVCPGIAIRFGVTVQQICQWNNIKNPDLIYINQKLTIFPTILR